MSGILGISPRLFRLPGPKQILSLVLPRATRNVVLLQPLRSGIVVLLHGVAAVCTEYVFQVEGLSRVGCQSTSINTFPFQCKTGVLEALPLDSSILLYNVSWCNTLQTT